MTPIIKKTLESTREVLKQMNINSKICEDFHFIDEDKIVKISIQFTGNISNKFSLYMPLSEAIVIANKMYMGMMNFTEYCPEIESALCELCNMICGNLSTTLSNVGIKNDILPPKLDVLDKGERNSLKSERGTLNSEKSYLNTKWK